jgi:hypothetical protein
MRQAAISRGRNPSSHTHQPVRDIAEVQHTAEPACRTPLRAHHEDLPEGQIEIAPLPLVVGEGCSQQRAVEQRCRAHVDRSSVEPRAAGARRNEQLALEGVVYHRKLEPSAMLVGDGDAELGKAMREVGGAVEWINNPPMLALPRAGPALFGEDRVIRKRAFERSDDDFFRFPVGLGDQIQWVGPALDLDPAKAP